MSSCVFTDSQFVCVRRDFLRNIYCKNSLVGEARFQGKTLHVLFVGTNDLEQTRAVNNEAHKTLSVSVNV